MKIFISAHELSPIQGSECRSAWNILTRLSHYHDLTIFCAETNQFKTSNYKTHINDHIGSFREGTKVVFIEQPFLTNLISKINKFFFGSRSNIGNNILYFTGVRFWEKSVYKYIKKNFPKKEFPDLFHHFNHISFREPGYCWKLDIPFVWGPVSGMVTPPKKFINSLNFNLRQKVIFRNFLNFIQANFDSRVNNAAKLSKHIFCVGIDDYKFFKNLNRNISFMSDMGTNKIERSFDEIKKQNNRKLVVSLIGRLDELKAPHIALECFKSSKKIRENALIRVIGDGPLLEDLKKKYSVFLGTSVEWFGKISYEKVKLNLLETDILIHTSIKEAGSAVVLEALEHCVPVLCHDAFGMAYTVNERCGIKVKMESNKDSIEGFKEAIEFLIDNESALNNLKLGASKRSEELSWDNMTKEISEIYNKSIFL